MDDLIRSCLRMKPHRILVGEVRGTEALTAMEAWNTGHPGGSMTIHANNAMEGLNRIVFLCRRRRINSLTQPGKDRRGDDSPGCLHRSRASVSVRTQGERSLFGERARRGTLEIEQL